MLTSRQLALMLCKAEGKRQQVNIAQMSEIVKCLRVIFRNMKPWEVVRWLWE